MHYANGRAAKLGDLVRGKGYNFGHEFTGLLIEAHPEASACNCTVATVSRNSLVAPLVYDYAQAAAREAGFPISAYSKEVRATLEYGQLDAFVAIDPDTGEVLLPEEVAPVAEAAPAAADPAPAEAAAAPEPSSDAPPAPVQEASDGTAEAPAGS